jgi:hypothetical protein
MKIQSIKIGIFIAILGIASIVLAQTANILYTGYLRAWLLYGGIAVLIIGAGIALFLPCKQNKQ